MAHDKREQQSGLRRTVERLARCLGECAVAAAVVVAGLGWLYLIDAWGGSGPGPRFADALPLLQLAGRDAVSWVAVVAVWAITGAVAGVVLSRKRRPVRAVLAGGIAAAILAVGSDVSYAIARNDALWTVVGSRIPGAGVLVGVLAVIAGTAAVRSPSVRAPG